MKEAIDPARELTTSGGSMKQNRYSHAQRNALLCALLVGACILATYPVAEMGIIDDWSYTKTALDLARTGHLLYNGQGAPMLGWQAAWGALFIKLFGFSFTVVRLSTLPPAMASAYLLYQILVRFEIAPRLAVFGALTLGLSPLFIPLAASFMTDVPSLFVILLCIYMCQRAVAAASDRSALFWLCSAALVNVAGGTVRQIAWLPALVMVPSTAWLLRKRRGMLPAGILLWTASVAAIFCMLHWFSQQPYVMSEAAFESGPIHFAMFPHLLLLLLYAWLCLALVVLPILGVWLPSAAMLNLRAWARIGICMLAVIAFYIFLRVHGLSRIHGNLESNIMPWIPHVLGWQGIHPGRSQWMLGSPPVTLRLWMRVAISLIVVAAGLAFVEQMNAKQWCLRSVREKLPSWRELFWILGPFAFSYVALLLPRAIHWTIFDRYLLPLMVVPIAVLLKLYQQEIATKVPAAGWVILAIFAFYTVAATHDWFALDRARVFAADKVLASGVPRTEVQGGMEYDGWTQIRNGGHVNNSYIRIPQGAYQPNVPLPPVAPDCQLPFSNGWSSVRPKYFLSFEPMDCLAASSFSPVRYRAWLPPFDRAVYIQQLPAGPEAYK